MYTRKEFENGAVLQTYAVNTNLPTTNVSIDIFIPYGLLDGYHTSHLAEHMIFKSNRFRNQKDLLRLLEGSGIMCNAVTYEDKMNLHVIAPSEHAGMALKMLYESFINKEFNKEELEQEKQVIYGELMAINSSPLRSMTENIQHNLFMNHPLDIPLNNTNDILLQTAEDVIKAKETFFGPSGLCISVVGDMDERKIIDSVGNTFGSLEASGKGKQKLPSNKINAISIGEEKDIKTGYVDIALMAPGMENTDTTAMELLAHSLGGNGRDYVFSNRLFQKIRVNEGLAYAAYANYRKYNGIGALIFEVCGMKKENIPRAEEIILNEMELLKHEPLPLDEFESVKTNLLTSKTKNRYTTAPKLSEWLCDAELYGIPWTLEHLKKELNSITPEKLIDVANKYFDGNYLIGRIIPTQV